MKPVGKPDAGNPRVRFDEREWETGRRDASAPAPILDSTAGSLEAWCNAMRGSGALVKARPRGRPANRSQVCKPAHKRFGIDAGVEGPNGGQE
jgi:hypothetical protein